MPGVNRRRSSMLLLGATKTITAISKRATFCWYETFLSLVRNTSNSAAANASSSPLVLLAQPISGAVLASWPTSSRLRRLGRHSSSRTRTGEECLLGLFQRRDGLLAGDRREVVEELRKGWPASR